MGRWYPIGSYGILLGPEGSYRVLRRSYGVVYGPVWEHGIQECPIGSYESVWDPMRSYGADGILMGAMVSCWVLWGPTESSGGPMVLCMVLCGGMGSYSVL